MKVVIAGGTGLIGRALTASLIGDGHHVTILTRDPDRVKPPIPGARLIRWDSENLECWNSMVNGMDAVVNLAGTTLNRRWTESHKQQILKSRVETSQAIAAAIKSVDNKPEVLIQSSGVGFYGTGSDEPITEDAPSGDDFLSDVCEKWESASKPVKTFGVRHVIIRSGVVLSKQGGALATLLPLFRMFLGGPVGSGKQYMPWIHIGDEIDAIRYLIDNEKASGVFNLTSPGPVTNREFAKTLGKALGRPTTIRTPAFALKLLFGEMSTIILDGQRAVPHRLLDSGFRFRFVNLEAALRDIIYGLSEI